MLPVAVNFMFPSDQHPNVSWVFSKRCESLFRSKNVSVRQQNDPVIILLRLTSQVIRPSVSNNDVRHYLEGETRDKLRERDKMRT